MQTREEIHTLIDIRGDEKVLHTAFADYVDNIQANLEQMLFELSYSQETKKAIDGIRTRLEKLHKELDE